ncbi:hypothetical protein LZ30DRAFT_605949, partial [Colletotrichum cereale]
SPLPGFISTNQQHSDEPETPHHEESQDSEESTVEFSASKYHYLEGEERFILNARLRQEPWKVTREAYMTQFDSFSYEFSNLLNMKVCRLEEKYPEIKAILKKSNVIAKLGRSIKRKKSQTVREGVQQLSPEEAIRAAQTVLYFLGRPDCDGLVPADDCMALIGILSQLNQINRQNQQ